MSFWAQDLFWFGFSASSQDWKSTLRPLMPPCSLTAWKNSFDPRSSGVKASGPRAPLTAVMLPTLIDDSVTPVSLAWLGPAAVAPPAAAAASAAPAVAPLPSVPAVPFVPAWPGMVEPAVAAAGPAPVAPCATVRVVPSPPENAESFSMVPQPDADATSTAAATSLSPRPLRCTYPTPIDGRFSRRTSFD